MDSIVEEQNSQVQEITKITNENPDLLPLPDHKDEDVTGNSTMERLMAKENEADGGRNKGSIATLNNDLVPLEKAQINKDIYTPNGNSINELN